MAWYPCCCTLCCPGFTLPDMFLATIPENGSPLDPFIAGVYEMPYAGLVAADIHQWKSALVTACANVVGGGIYPGPGPAQQFTVDVRCNWRYRSVVFWALCHRRYRSILLEFGRVGGAGFVMDCPTMTGTSTANVWRNPFFHIGTDAQCCGLVPFGSAGAHWLIIPFT